MENVLENVLVPPTTILLTRPRSQFFTKRTDQPANKKLIALGSEIKETIQGDLRHHHILLFWRRTLQKIKRDIDSSR